MVRCMAGQCMGHQEYYDTLVSHTFAINSPPPPIQLAPAEHM